MTPAVSIQEIEFAAFPLPLESQSKHVNNSEDFTAYIACSSSGHYDVRDVLWREETKRHIKVYNISQSIKGVFKALKGALLEESRSYIFLILD